MLGVVAGRFAGALERLKTGKARQVVGVDIGTSSLKVCLLKKTKEGALNIAGLACRSYDQDLLHDGSIIDRPFLAKEIRDILAASAIKARLAASALSSYSVITKRVTMPLLEKDALESAVRLEVENIIPFPLKDIHYSYSIMGADGEKEGMTNLLVVAVKKEIVEGYIKTFEMAGLRLCLLDVDILAVTNLVEQIYGSNEHAVLAADVGASVTNIAIVKGAGVEFTREILMGGKYVTRELAKRQELPYAEAEERKLSCCDGASVLLDEFVSDVALEIRKTVNFYAATKPGSNVGRIYLTGGSALAPGIKERIEAETGIAVEPLDPFLSVGGAAEASGSEALLVPVALYLSAMGGR